MGKTNQQTTKSVKDTGLDFTLFKNIMYGLTMVKVNLLSNLHCTRGDQKVRGK